MSATSLPAITLPDGSTLSLAWTPAPAAAPAPTPAPAPTSPLSASPAPNEVSVAAAGTSFPLTAINPTAAAFPGGRGPNQLVAYQAPLTVTSTNMWGAEVQVTSLNVVQAINDRQITGVATGTAIPAGWYVLSGHGTARDFLLTLKPGQVVTPRYVPTATPTPVHPAGTKVLAVYYQLGVDQVSQIPAGTTQLRLAFGTGDPPRLTGAAPDLSAFRAGGGTVLLSLGGEGGAITQSDHAGIIAAVSAIAAQVGGLDGLDWDIEATGLSVADVVAVSKALAVSHPGWVTSFTPPGGPPVAVAISAAAQLAAAGLTVQWAQQLYGATVTTQQAVQQCQLAVAGGVPAGSVLVGVMIGSDSTTWTVAQATAAVQAVKAAVPGIGGAAWWHAGIGGTAASVAAVSAVLA